MPGKKKLFKSMSFGGFKSRNKKKNVQESPEVNGKKPKVISENNNVDESEKFSASFMIDESNAFRRGSKAPNLANYYTGPSFRYPMNFNEDKSDTPPKAEKKQEEKKVVQKSHKPRRESSGAFSSDDDLYLDDTVDNKKTIHSLELNSDPSEDFLIKSDKPATINEESDTLMPMDEDVAMEGNKHTPTIEPTENNRQESLAINFHNIHKLMSNDDSEEESSSEEKSSILDSSPPRLKEFISEDSEALLSQLHSALDANPVVQNLSTDETDTLEEQLKESDGRRQLLQEKLARMKEREKLLREADEELKKETAAGGSPSKKVIEKILKASANGNGNALNSEAQQDLKRLDEATERLRTSLEQANLQVTEIIEQRNRLQEQQEQIEKFEQERNFHAIKIAELAELLKMNNQEDVQNYLAQKSMQVAQLDHEAASLKKKLSIVEARANPNVLGNIAATPAVSGVVIPQNRALEATILNLQNKIEELELEKSQYMDTIEEMNDSVTAFAAENDIQDQKIAALENGLNLTQMKKKPVDITQEKLQRFKVWANTKMTKAQAQYEAIKHDLELRQASTNPDQILT